MKEEELFKRFKKRKLRKNIARIWCRFCNRTLFTQEWYQTENLIDCCVECYEKMKKEYEGK